LESREVVNWAATERNFGKTLESWKHLHVIHLRVGDAEIPQTWVAPERLQGGNRGVEGDQRRESPEKPDHPEVHYSRAGDVEGDEVAAVDEGQQ